MFIIKRYTVNDEKAFAMWMQRDIDGDYVPRLDREIAARFPTQEEAATVAYNLRNDPDTQFNHHGEHYYEVVEVEV